MENIKLHHGHIWIFWIIIVPVLSSVYDNVLLLKLDKIRMALGIEETLYWNMKGVG